jgi:hypothetical protein
MIDEPHFRDPEPTDLYWAAIALLPHLPNKLLREDTRIKKAVQLARDVWNEAYEDVVQNCVRGRFSAIERELRDRTIELKKLVQPADQKDESTAQVYLKMQHNLTYKTVGRLREQLVRAGIPFRVLYSPFITQSHCEYVLTSDLDKFAEIPRAKERERKRATREKRVVKKIRSETTQKRPRTTQTKPANASGQVHK